MIIPKIPVFAGVFDVFWVATIFASDAGHRSIIRGSRRRECVGVGVCGCVWVFRNRSMPVDHEVTEKTGAPGGDRTHNLQLRRLTLCPIELQARDEVT